MSDNISPCILLLLKVWRVYKASLNIFQWVYTWFNRGHHTLGWRHKNYRIWQLSACTSFQGSRMCRLYSCPAGYKTHCIPWERSVLSLHLWSALGFTLGSSSASLKHWPFPWDITGLISHLAGVQTYTMLRLF